MKAILQVTEKGLRGATPDDHEKFLKFKRRIKRSKPGAWFRFEWSSPRNPKQHAKMIVLLRFICDNHETYDTVERALVAVKLAAGYFDPHVDPVTNEVLKVPHSVNFESMGQEDFERFYSAAINGILSVILPQFDRPKMERMLDTIVQGWIAEAPY